MDKELIERLADQASRCAADAHGWVRLEDQRVAFAALVAEECAKVVEEEPLAAAAASRKGLAAAIREKFKLA